MPKLTRPQLYIIAAVILLGFILLIFFIFSQSAKNGPQKLSGNSTTSAGSPTLVPYNKNNLKPGPGQPSIYQQSKEYQDFQNNVKLTEAPELERRKKSGALLDVIPYKGKLFTFDYDYSKGAYRVTFNKDNVLEANTEFNTWLKVQGIEDKSWLFNLQIAYK
jgi:hypothetical protein